MRKDDFSLHNCIKKCFNSVDLEDNYFNATLSNDEIREKVEAHSNVNATHTKYDAYKKKGELLGQDNLVETFCQNESPRYNSRF